MNNIQLTVKGMHCNSCKIIVTESLEEIGAKNIKIDLNEKKKIAKISCEFDDESKIIESITKEGYKVIK